MPTNRENLVKALEGRRPDHIPFTINEEFITNDPAWNGLIAQGLCPIGYSSTVKERTENVERTVTHSRHGEYLAERLTLCTPLGDITQVSIQGWIQEYFLKDRADYRIMEYVVRNTKLEVSERAFIDCENKIGEKGITLIGAHRTPMQRILVDYAGLEHFAFHLADGFPELFALQEALMDKVVERCRLIARGPGRYVSLLENLTAEQWGPRRFAEYHLPVYKKILPVFHAGGKKVYAHFDGKLACLKDLIAQTDIDGIESLTMPPEGDLSYAQARKQWPEKLLWCNINVSNYNLPPAALRTLVRERVGEAAPDGRLCAFEISEDCPGNWKRTIKVVLDELGG